MLKTIRFVFTLALLICLPAIIGLGWWQRDYLMGWYLTHQLIKAAPENQEPYIEALARLGENAQYPVIDHLEIATESTAPHITLALKKMILSWGGTSTPFSKHCFHHIARRFATFSKPAQVETLKLMGSLQDLTSKNDSNLKNSCLTKDLLEATKLILEHIPDINNPFIYEPAISLITTLIKINSDKDLHARFSTILAKAIAEAPEKVKIQAIQLALSPEAGMIELCITALQDKNVEVRKVAILACAPAIDTISVDALLPCLHDSEPEIRAYCESALIARGLKKEHIQLGKLITDPRPSKRLQVLDSLMDDNDLDQGLWLRKLSHDSSPAVRVAAVRLMSLQAGTELQDRIDQMSRTDPSKTVADLASYYLKMNKSESFGFEILGNLGTK